MGKQREALESIKGIQVSSNLAKSVNTVQTLNIDNKDFLKFFKQIDPKIKNKS